MPRRGRLRAPKGALFCTVANMGYGLVAGLGGCLFVGFGAVGAAGTSDPSILAALSFFCDFALCGLGLLAAGIWGIVGLVQRSRALVSALKVGMIAAAVGVPGAILSCVMGIAVAIASDEIVPDDPDAPAGAVAAVLAVVAVAGFLPVPLCIFNLVAWLRARKQTYWSDGELRQVFE